MYRHATRSMRAGFTLVEMIVTLIILGILVAAILPVVVAQVDDAEPTRGANDLANMATAIELFHVNIRPTYPGDLEDLAVLITTSDAGIDSTTYTTGQVGRWKGPYISSSVPALSDSVQTAYDGYIRSDLHLFDSDVGSGGAPEESASFVTGDFVAVEISGLTSAQFELVNDYVDGTGETNGPGASQSQQIGRLRRVEKAAADTSVYYLATPYKSS